MLFWFAIFLCMFMATMTTAGCVAAMWKWHERRKILLAKIERGNAAFEHLLNQQKAPAPPPLPFPKKVE